MTDDTLPPLPRPASLSDHSIAPFVGQYSADQMRTYAAEAVRAALAAQVPQWLPMDAVPKDGRRVLVAIEGVDRAVVAMWNGGAWETVDGNCWTGRAITHWMPLPAAPGASPPPAALAVPDGWALVPRKTTPAIRDALRLISRWDHPSDELCSVRWAAAIAASPQAPADTQPQGREGRG